MSNTFNNFVGVQCLKLMFKRPGVAGAVLQTPLSLTESFSHSSLEEHLHSKFVRARERKFTSPHLSCVTCPMSHVMCQFFFFFFFIQSGETSRWRVFTESAPLGSQLSINGVGLTKPLTQPLSPQVT